MRLQVSNLANFVLDGSTSKDLDVDDSLPDQGLEFSWRCTLVNDGRTDVCYGETGAELVLSQTPSLIIEAGKLLPTVSHPYTFTLSVSKSGKLPSIFSVPITVLNRYVPVATISIISNHREKDDGSRQINAGDKLILDGSCQDSSRLKWSISPSVNLQDSSLFPLGFSAMSFVIKEGAKILKPGVIYFISFECTARGSIATAKLVLEVNTPPQGGICKACLITGTAGCSKNGAAIFDAFIVSCSNFADRDAPLRCDDYKIHVLAGA